MVYSYESYAFVFLMINYLTILGKQHLFFLVFFLGGGGGGGG